MGLLMGCGGQVVLHWVVEWASLGPVWMLRSTSKASAVVGVAMTPRQKGLPVAVHTFPYGQPALLLFVGKSGENFTSSSNSKKASVPR